MSTEHDELFDTARSVIDGELGILVNGSDIDNTADALSYAILATGYRKPRTVTTTEELDALPEGSVILGGGVVPRIRTEIGWVGDGAEVDSEHIIYWLRSATVLHDGSAA